MWTDDRIYVDIVTALERDCGSMGRNVGVAIGEPAQPLSGTVRGITSEVHV